MPIRQKIIKTNHGEIHTPAFLPDATYGSINSLSFKDCNLADVKEIVTTTMHLELKLGSEYIEKMGGLHKFFNWNRPILTDSGGFQVFSLIHRRGNKKNKITDLGAEFVDPATGSKFLLTPENSQQIQNRLGSDIRVVLDEPQGLGASHEQALESVVRTTSWAKRSKEEFQRLNTQTVLLGGVIQGGGILELRKRSALELMEIGFDTYNFGGLPILPDGSLDLELSKYLVDLLPEDKIRYAMGIGTPDDIVNLAKMGWDLFDCVLPTRNARHGYLFVPKGEGDKDYDNYSVMHLKSERYKYADIPIASDIPDELKNVSRAYLRHLIRIKEPAGFRLATINNLYFYSQITKKLRNGQI